MGESPVSPPEAHRQEIVSGSQLFSRGGLFCVLIVALCILLIWPVAEAGIQDDPVYALTTLDFAHTGHFIFHGWASPMLGWQAIWGSLFVKLFGPTFTAMRLSMVPVVLLSVLLYHAILRRFGLNPIHATFGTLCLAVGPLFLPLSVTFMTDLPGLFAVLVCLYFCQLAINASTNSRAILFLAMAALGNVLLGTARQIAWLGVLVMVPSCVWLLRRRRYVQQGGIALWLAGVACIYGLTRWFARQPFTAPEKLIPGSPDLHLAGRAVVQFVCAALTTLLFLLPVLTLGLHAFWPPRRQALVRMASALLAVFLLVALIRWIGHVQAITFPWLGVTFGMHGILQDGLFVVDPQIPVPMQKLLFLLVAIGTVACVEIFLTYRQSSATQQSSLQSRSWHQISVLLLPFLVANCLMLIPRATFFGIFDRYLLEIVPIVLIPILLWHQEHVSLRMPFVATTTVVVIAVLIVADMHGLFSAYRAQVRLVQRVQEAGIPRTEIRGDLAFNLVTQAEAWGYINDPRILNPPDAYKPQASQASFTLDGTVCGIYTLQRFFPAVHARYEISSSPVAPTCLTPTDFPPESYRAWLPPLRRQLFIRRILSAEDLPRQNSR